MPFWREDTEEEKQRKAVEAKRKQDQEQSIRQLEDGGLPVQATRRLQEQTASGSKFFSSTLTAKEYLLAREAGYQPIGQVMGSAFWQVGYGGFVGYGFGYSMEVSTLTMALKQSRELALSRLRQEAQLLGADGVIGVHIKRSQFAWSQGLSEFTAVGTAIKLTDRSLLAGAKNLPFTSSLSGKEFWQLCESGYWPCALVMGNCSYFVFGDIQTRSAMTGFMSSIANQELIQLQDGFNWARRIATNRLQEEIVAAGADGAVAMDIEHDMHHIHYESGNMVNFMINFTALGTAVTRRPDGKARIRHQPLMIMDLASKTKREIEFDVSMNNLTKGGFDDEKALN